jgi:hypothetical protein
MKESSLFEAKGSDGVAYAKFWPFTYPERRDLVLSLHGARGGSCLLAKHRFAD